VIASYLEAVERGESPDARAWIARHPDLAPELSLFFADRAEFQQVAGERSPNVAATHDAPTPVETPARDPNQTTWIYEEPILDGTQRAANRFGDYELLEEIARGGMGVVYKARQVTLNRIVALKMILAGQLASAQDVKRFYTEAEAAASLDHPNIVPIYEVGQHGGQHYFSMGYVAGRSLAARVAEGPLPPREAAELVKTVAGAVHYAHERGVIHRDLKPGNILLQNGGVVSGRVVSGRDSGTTHHSPLTTHLPKVTDFGLAKLVESGSDLTGSGQILGTPSYVPPEQAEAKPGGVGRTADVYSLGAILNCLLTGRPPFQAATPLETLLQVLEHEPASPRQLNPGIPLDLDTIVLKCLEKSPERRYATAQNLADELSRFLAGLPIHSRRIGRAERGWRWQAQPSSCRLVRRGCRAIGDCRHRNVRGLFPRNWHAPHDRRTSLGFAGHDPARDEGQGGRLSSRGARARSQGRRAHSQGDSAKAFFAEFEGKRNIDFHFP